MNPKPLTEREQQVLDFIASYREKRGYSPSMRDICKGCYFGSTRSASYYINQLVMKGAIDYTPRTPRSITPKHRDAV